MGDGLPMPITSAISRPSRHKIRGIKYPPPRLPRCLVRSLHLRHKVEKSLVPASGTHIQMLFEGRNNCREFIYMDESLQNLKTSMKQIIISMFVTSLAGGRPEFAWNIGYYTGISYSINASDFKARAVHTYSIWIYTSKCFWVSTYLFLLCWEWTMTADVMSIY